MARILFPDLSDFQPNVDLTNLTRWQRSQYGIAFVVLKATEGGGFVSPRFKARWQQLDHLAEVRGAYHFAHVGSDSPKGEADHFWNTVNAAGIRREKGKSDILILDAEQGDLSPRAARSWMGTFLAHLDARSHAAKELRPAWIYGGSWLREHLSPGPIERYLWLAAYLQDPTPYVPEQFTDRLFVAHQYTDGEVGPLPHTIKGVGASDLSWFRGDAKRLRAVAGVL